MLSWLQLSLTHSHSPSLSLSLTLSFFCNTLLLLLLCTQNSNTMSKGMKLTDCTVEPGGRREGGEGGRVWVNNNRRVSAYLSMSASAIWDVSCTCAPLGTTREPREFRCLFYSLFVLFFRPAGGTQRGCEGRRGQPLSC